MSRYGYGLGTLQTHDTRKKINSISLRKKRHAFGKWECFFIKGYKKQDTGDIITGIINT